MTDPTPAAGQPHPLTGQPVPDPPAVVSERYPDATPRLVEYAAWLADAGTVRGLIGPREVPRLWDRHLLNSIALTELLPTGIRLVDIGTGAGLPGIALAIARPDLRVDLVESLRRRTDFLSEVVAALDLTGRVRVIRGRAEDSAVVRVVGGAEFVTARAVAPLDKLIRWAFPLLAPGGSLMAMKGATAEAEVAEHAAVIRRSHGRLAGVIECGVGFVEPPTRVIQLIKQ